MSQFADLVGVFRSAKRKYGLNDDQAANLFLDVLGAIEWDFSFGTDFSLPPKEFHEQEVTAAKLLINQPGEIRE